MVMKATHLPVAPPFREGVECKIIEMKGACLIINLFTMMKAPSNTFFRSYWMQKGQSRVEKKNLNRFVVHQQIEWKHRIIKWSSPQSCVFVFDKDWWLWWHLRMVSAFLWYGSIWSRCDSSMSFNFVTPYIIMFFLHCDASPSPLPLQ